MRSSRKRWGSKPFFLRLVDDQGEIVKLAGTGCFWMAEIAVQPPCCSVDHQGELPRWVRGN